MKVNTHLKLHALFQSVNTKCRKVEKLTWSVSYKGDHMQLLRHSPNYYVELLLLAFSMATSLSFLPYDHLSSFDYRRD